MVKPLTHLVDDVAALSKVLGEESGMLATRKPPAQLERALYNALDVDIPAESRPFLRLIYSFALERRSSLTCILSLLHTLMRCLGALSERFDLVTEKNMHAEMHSTLRRMSHTHSSRKKADSPQQRTAHIARRQTTDNLKRQFKDMQRRSGSRASVHIAYAGGCKQNNWTAIETRLQGLKNIRAYFSAMDAAEQGPTATTTAELRSPIDFAYWPGGEEYCLLWKLRESRDYHARVIAMAHNSLNQDHVKYLADMIREQAHDISHMLRPANTRLTELKRRHTSIQSARSIRTQAGKPSLDPHLNAQECRNSLVISYCVKQQQYLVNSIDAAYTEIQKLVDSATQWSTVRFESLRQQKETRRRAAAKDFTEYTQRKVGAVEKMRAFVRR
jgi:hypothetical protein